MSSFRALRIATHELPCYCNRKSFLHESRSQTFPNYSKFFLSNICCTYCVTKVPFPRDYTLFFAYCDNFIHGYCITSILLPLQLYPWTHPVLNFVITSLIIIVPFIDKHTDKRHIHAHNRWTRTHAHTHAQPGISLLRILVKYSQYINDTYFKTI